MTTEPRQEAERIVGEFVVAEVEQATEPSESAMYRAGAYRDRLVDALAAAIEVERQHREEQPGPVTVSGPMQSLLSALSALRGDETT